MLTRDVFAVASPFAIFFRSDTHTHTHRIRYTFILVTYRQTDGLHPVDKYCIRFVRVTCFSIFRWWWSSGSLKFLIFIVSFHLPHSSVMIYNVYYTCWLDKVNCLFAITLKVAHKFPSNLSCSLSDEWVSEWVSKYICTRRPKTGSH